jgi:hypothetical protein
VTLAIEAPLLPVEDAVRVRVEETVALFDGETQDREGGVELDVDDAEGMKVAIAPVNVWLTVADALAAMEPVEDCT